MYEYLTDAVVLERYAAGDKDSTVSFFTKRFGKLIGRAQSARKITSKLSGHLEPGIVLKVRLLEKRGLRVVDALKYARTTIALQDLRFLNRLLGDGEPDQRIWRMFLKGKLEWKPLLALLGWDAAYARCASCGGVPEAFDVRAQEFFCTWCSSSLKQGEVLYIHHDS